MAFEEIGTRRSGGRDGLRAGVGPGVVTVPPMVIDGRRIGGARDLAALEASGELDRLLSPEAPASAPPAAPR